MFMIIFSQFVKCFTRRSAAIIVSLIPALAHIINSSRCNYSNLV